MRRSVLSEKNLGELCQRLNQFEQMLTPAVYARKPHARSITVIVIIQVCCLCRVYSAGNLFILQLRFRLGSGG